MKDLLIKLMRKINAVITYPTAAFVTPPRLWASFIYKKSLGKNIDWNDPKTLNEKINWLKFYSDTSKWTILADKYNVREYIVEKGLQDILVPLYGTWDKAEDINFNSLPNSFVLKTNHGSGDAIIIRDKSSINEKFIKRRLKKNLKQHYGRVQSEPHYLKIHPRVIAEELLSESGTCSPTDYKIWCFDGKPYAIWVCRNRTSESVEVSTYDLDWNIIPYAGRKLEHSHYLQSTKEVPRPKNLEDMLQTASKLSEGFPQVRVDLYNINGKIYFGEMTFTSMGGYMTFYSDEFQLELGNQVKLPNAKARPNN